MGTRRSRRFGSGTLLLALLETVEFDDSGARRGLVPAARLDRAAKRSPARSIGRTRIFYGAALASSPFDSVLRTSTLRP